MVWIQAGKELPPYVDSTQMPMGGESRHLSASGGPSPPDHIAASPASPYDPPMDSSWSKEPYHSAHGLPVEDTSPSGTAGLRTSRGPKGRGSWETAKRVQVETWYPEIGALCLSIAAMVAMVVFMWKLDGQPLAEWKGAVSINTVVSILSVVASMPLAYAVGSCLSQEKWSWYRERQGPVRGFVAFDDAARGPMGAFQLLWWLKSMHWVSIGAWVTILRLFSDPFLQAVVNYEGKPYVAAQSNATIGRAAFLDVGEIKASSAGAGMVFSILMQPDITLSTGILGSLVNQTSAAQDRPPFLQCSTGNCTWAPYSTIDVCSSCADISSHITSEFKNGSQADLDTCAAGGVKVALGQNITTYSVPYKAHKNLSFAEFNKFREKDLCQQDKEWFPISAVFLPNETYSFRSWDTLLASFAILRAGEDYWSNQVNWQNATMTATECAFRLCGNVYSASMENGQLTETLVDDVAFRRASNSFQLKGGSVDTSEDPELGSSLVSSSHMAYPKANYEAPFNRRYDLQLVLEAPEGSPIATEVETKLNITQISIESVIQYLMLNTTLDSIASALVTSNNFTAAFEQSSKIISNRIRAVDANVTTGSTIQWVVYVEVDWAFMTVPAVGFVASVVFALGTFWMTPRGQLQMTKGDMLPNLLHGLDPETRAELRAMKDRGEPVGDIQIRLVQGNHGVELSRVDGPP